MAIGLFALTLSACGANAAATPVKAEPATQTFSPPSATPLPAPTDTAVPPTETAISAPTEAPPAGEVSFANDVMPILSSGGCTKCHGIEQVKEGLDMTSHANLMAGSFNGKAIVAETHARTDSGHRQLDQRGGAK